MLSGGGAGGAFSAGALVGLSRRGERPAFALVTGVSTGALIAPFAFLGPAWDQQLTDAFATNRSEHLLRFPGIGLLFHAGVYQSKPLIEFVDLIFTDQLIDAVGEESAKGRMLLVATTDLDTEDTVIWDMGAIASRGGADAHRLFRKVLVASASYPGLLPPVLIRVEDPGGVYDEMHVDGGTTVPFFIAPYFAEIAPDAREALRGANLYVLLNRQLDAPPQTTREKMLPIMMRSFSSTLRLMSRTTLEFNAAVANRYGMNLRIGSIPVEYPLQGPFNFHTPVLQTLFSYAANCTQNGQLWTTPEQALNRGMRAPTSVPAPAAPCPSAGSSRQN